jgi:hypothetical protein
MDNTRHFIQVRMTWPGSHFCGPGTPLAEYLGTERAKYVNELDFICMLHDLCYWHSYDSAWRRKADFQLLRRLARTTPRTFTDHVEKITIQLLMNAKILIRI